MRDKLYSFKGSRAVGVRHEKLRQVYQNSVSALYKEPVKFVPGFKSAYQSTSLV